MSTVAHPVTLTFDSPPLVMGIVNCTPDSFFPSSRAEALADAVIQSKRLIDEGADILDIGGESSRPGADYVDEEEELRRVLPVIQEIRKFSDIPLSVDTRKSVVAREVLEAGADVINDISALEDDPHMGKIVGSCGAYIILMHKRGTPRDMQVNPRYDETVNEIKRELETAVKRARRAGIEADRIILDPGIGFGKRHEDNLAILRQTDSFTAMGYPVLIGHSRKSFLERITGRKVEERIYASLAAGVVAQMKGADILRVHDVAATLDAVRVVNAIERGV